MQKGFGQVLMIPKKIITMENILFHIAHRAPWPGQQEFVVKLAAIEREPSIRRESYRGYAPSRLEFRHGRAVDLGNSEFVDPATRITWIDAMGRHYIGKFNVIPSREFYYFVMDYKLQKR